MCVCLFITLHTSLKSKNVFSEIIGYDIAEGQIIPFNEHSQMCTSHPSLRSSKDIYNSAKFDETPRIYTIRIQIY